MLMELIKQKEQYEDESDMNTSHQITNTVMSSKLKQSVDSSVLGAMSSKQHKSTVDLI